MNHPTAATGPYPFREHRTVAETWAEHSPEPESYGLFDRLDDSADRDEPAGFSPNTVRLLWAASIIVFFIGGMFARSAW